MRRLLLSILVCGCAYAHVVSMSSGELHVEGRSATYELRIPMYEVAHVTNPETALLDQLKFEGARRTSSNCQEQDGTYICRADYEFTAPVPDKIEVECTLFQVTVPNHVHLLYAVQGPNSDQAVFDQSFRRAEVRFHPPSRAELIAKAAAAGIARLPAQAAQPADQVRAQALRVPQDDVAHPQSTDPPLTFTISPVMCRASGEQRNTTGPAMSSAVATRPSGMPASTRSRPPSA